MEGVHGQGPARFVVVAMRPGRANGLAYPAGVLQASVAAGRWNGAAVFLDHPSALDGTRAGGRSVADLAGVLEEAWYDDGVWARLATAGPRGPAVAALAGELLSAAEAGRPAPAIGLSADLLVLRDAAGTVREIRRVHSVDVVVQPAAGGAFVRALHGGEDGDVAGDGEPYIDDEEGVRMEQVRETLELATTHCAMEARGIMETQETYGTLSAGRRDEPLPWEDDEAPADDAAALVQVQCEHALNAALRDAGLPAPLEESLRGQFEGRVFGAGELRRAVEAQQRAWAGLLEAGTVRGLGRPRASAGGMLDPLDRVRLAWDRALGLPLPDAHGDVPRLSGIRELYLTLTGDVDFHGRLVPERALLANATTATMAGVVADGLNKVMLGAYNRREKWWAPIVANRDLDRFQPMKMIRFHGFSSLRTVAEGDPYLEQTWDDVRETATIAKTGDYIGLTLEMILADDMDAVRAIPTLLGSAAYNTASDMVSAVFTANAGVGPAMADTFNVFDADNHANLREVALSVEELDAVATAMMDQTEPGSLRKLAVPPAYVLVPTALRSTALRIRNSMLIPGDPANDANPWYNAFEVVVVPPWTDATDWAAVASPAQVEGIVMGWLLGRQEPEIFVADAEVAGSMFTNDELRIKVRWFLCVGVADYRGLHKNNVADG